MTKKTLRRGKGFFPRVLLHHSLSLKDVRAGIQGKSRSRSRGGVQLTDLLLPAPGSLLSLPSYPPQDHLSEEALPAVSKALPHQLLIKTIP